MAERNGPGERLTLVLLIDAFRRDYVEHTRFIRGLADTAMTGTFREPFGFVPRAAYFGGLSPEEYGFSNMYCYDPEASPFGIASGMPRVASAAAERLSGIREKVEAFARSRSTPFTASYVSTLRIPLAFTPFFDAVEKRAPWDPAVGYRSLFHLLDERGLRWYQCSWPTTSTLPDSSDRAIVEHTLADLLPEHRFAYVHLQELDGTGHVHGPGSRELLRCLERTDDTVRHLVDSLRPRYRHLDVLLFGDHGMLNVVSTCDLWGDLDRTDLRFGVDYVHFMDSSMARFWFHTEGARGCVREILDRNPLGRILDDADLRRYRMSGCDPRNGELIFLAHPGVLIFPNFYQSDGDPIVGMHGYAPDCPDNEGFFLLASERHAERGSVGAVAAAELFPTLLDLLDLESGGEASALRRRAGTAPGRYTAHPDPDADRAIGQALGEIVLRIEKTCPRPPDAIVLAGSFGRGEGGVVATGAGFAPVNDLDLIVVSSDGTVSGDALRSLGAGLARQLGCDFVDISVSDGRWEALPPTIFNYELKYGARVLKGDTALLDRMPAYAAADIPLFEGVQLLFNRTAGLLTGLAGDDGRERSVEEMRYLARQVAKAYLAVGDWHLLVHGAYDASYRVRGTRFASLATALDVPDGVCERIARAYAFKLSADEREFAAPTGELPGVWRCLETTLVGAIGSMVQGTPRDLTEALALYEEFSALDPRLAGEERQRIARHPHFGTLLRTERTLDSVRASVYGTLPLLLAARVEGSERRFREAGDYLGKAFHWNAAGHSAPGDWENLRRQTMGLWEALTH
jgi:Type I phosphodiesterase / nucleotide pyrophosphatase